MLFNLLSHNMLQAFKRCLLSLSAGLVNSENMGDFKRKNEKLFTGSLTERINSWNWMEKCLLQYCDTWTNFSHILATHNGQIEQQKIQKHSWTQFIWVTIMHYGIKSWLRCHLNAWKCLTDTANLETRWRKGYKWMIYTLYQCLQSATDLYTFNYSLFNQANVTELTRNFGSYF